jgi:hypothetical protein
MIFHRRAECEGGFDVPSGPRRVHMCHGSVERDAEKSHELGREY